MAHKQLKTLVSNQHQLKLLQLNIQPWNIQNSYILQAETAQEAESGQ